MFRPVPDEKIAAHEISARINRVANDTPDLLDPITAQEKAEQEMQQAAKAEPKSRRKMKRDDGQTSLF
jgi:hypothetical protein